MINCLNFILNCPCLQCYRLHYKINNHGELTWALCCNKTLTHSFPMPLAPPNITAVLPVIFILMNGTISSQKNTQKIKSFGHVTFNEDPYHYCHQISVVFLNVLTYTWCGSLSLLPSNFNNFNAVFKPADHRDDVAR